MNKTPIQWCDDTVNLVMGCDGCELWPTLDQIQSDLLTYLLPRTAGERSEIRDEVFALFGEMTATEVWHRKSELASQLKSRFPALRLTEIHPLMEKRFRCYAGMQHLMRGENPTRPEKKGHPGHARIFEEPRKFEGRMAEAAKWPDLRGQDRSKKPWLNGLPRTIFISNMGDALSAPIDFDYLEEELIDNVISEAGQRHLWLWLTKRPDRMADFGAWLRDDRGREWPDNLVAMTSVTGRATRSRIDALRRVPARLRGLSVEPLTESVDLDLESIHWLIAGGESGKASRPFDIDWARSLKEQCAEAGVAYFLKQLGSEPVEWGFRIPFVDSHGGDWKEWPTDLRVREMPEAFQAVPA